MATSPQRATVFSRYIFANDTNEWMTFNTNTWTPTKSGDLLMTLTWSNHPNDATVKTKNAAMPAVECRGPKSTKTGSAEAEPPTTTTVSVEA
ncbi:hypothetical protein B0I37DRAFT_418374 [Chaetomium sp. MPI-CAGE-AT-0009]|nr:hypothetical protein B0I37DRAFT_418374 [Chaetomium sp. MPI-CAGE-AT-0009]